VAAADHPDDHSDRNPNRERAHAGCSAALRSRETFQ
jgi:hypothetical protein